MSALGAKNEIFCPPKIAFLTAVLLSGKNLSVRPCLIVTSVAAVP